MTTVGCAHDSPVSRGAVDQTTSTLTFVGLVMMSYTAERFCDCATSALISSGRRVGVDVVGHLDVAEPVADVAVDAEDAPDVHGPFDRRGDLAQLDLAVLRDGGDACGEAAGEAHEHVLDRRRTVVLRGEDLRVVDVEAELGPVVLLLAEPEEALDGGVAVGAVLPLTGRSPLELGGLGRRGQRFPCAAAVLRR